MREKFYQRNIITTTHTNYKVDYSILEINPINGYSKMFRAIIYKNGSVEDIKIAFTESNLDEQVKIWFDKQ